ncbi:hypothetical protein JZO66_06950 [Enterococcus sp. DIV0242_7C1]|uniref:Uncharacterized protein n=1 Tax=Candidatus Enterococcus dunnyi TaxID=1834192 RepID=A0A200J0J1_9ENTE|nr:MULTISPECIES: hypothetical protein [unclassified Enterococcus]MBO0470277.1 hypothetical protein [Enterococcus sp. DIV0242_7C1]OUZ30733.1 hypothetical protein A5889_003021 [Enterococcus sp. 9D6_DIV0238]
MTINHEIQQKIKQFAKEQSTLYLDDAEMTYMEKLRRKAGKSREKIGTKISRFKNTSDKSREMQDDMILYMNDYISDLIANGMSEEEAFEKASDALRFSSQTDQSDELQERFAQYYAAIDPADHEIIGLFYGGFAVLGLTIGALVGFLASGGVPEFMHTGWIYTLIGILAGVLIGTGFGLIANAILTPKSKI